MSSIGTKARFSNRCLGSMHTVRHRHQPSSLASAAFMLQHSRLTTAAHVMCCPVLFKNHSCKSALTNCMSDALRPSQTDGNEPLWQEEQQQSEDPVAAMLWAAQQDGMKIVVQDDGDFDELDDIMEDLEDPWMRNPSPPEWSSSPLFAVPDTADGGGSSSSASAAAAAPSSSGSSDPDITPSSQFVTLGWHQLEQLMQQRQQQPLIVLEVQCPESQQQQQQQTPPCRPLPDLLPWISLSQDGASVQQQQQQQQVALLQQDRIQIVKLGLADVTRDVADAWQQAGAVVAVWDSGHHSCLAAAIRLSAVYRLPDVVLLQQS